MCSGSEEGSYLRLIDFCITHFCVVPRQVPEGKGRFVTKLTRGELVFEGEIVGGEPDGEGQEWLPNGDGYVGEFVSGRRHGRGTLTTARYFFFTLVTGPRRSLSLKLSDTRVYAPQIRARLGTTAQVRLPPALTQRSIRRSRQKLILHHDRGSPKL